MNAFTPTQAVASAAAAMKAVEIAAAELAAERAKKAQFQFDLKTKKEDLARQREADQRDRAVRLVDGPAAAPEKASRSRKISRLDDEIPALMAALPLLDERIAEKERALEAARRPSDLAMLGVLGELQGPAIDQIQATLATLADPAVDLLASDIVRVRTVGDKYTSGGDQPVILSGSITVRKMIDGLPRRFRPASLNYDQLHRAAFARAAQITAFLQENSK